MLTYFLDKLNQPREHMIYTACTATLWWVVWDGFYLEMRLCDMIFYNRQQTGIAWLKLSSIDWEHFEDNSKI